jgi:alkanesulfonate monooxygenase SsuD/methylene tetrahydromethanopterin reductase-like flavin-dependent oxidoreductase (luciferase family)
VKFGLIYELALPIAEQERGRTESDVYWEALEQIVLAEKVGFDYVWLVEHHFLEDLSRSSSPEVFLAAVSQHTTRLRIGHGVVLAPPPFNHPIKVAERIGALDILSRGRVELGFGRSVTVEELGGFGIDPSESRPMMEEAIKLIPKLWEGRQFAGYEGQYVSIPPRVIVPKPIQKPHPPLWMACSTSSSFETAGRYGLGCLSFTSPGAGDLGDLLGSYRDALNGAIPVGKSVNDQAAAFTTLYCAPDNTEALARGGLASTTHFGRISQYFGGISSHKGYEQYGANVEERQKFAAGLVAPETLIDEHRMCIGDPEQCASVIDGLKKLGVDQFLGLVQFSDISHEESLRTIELMGEYVIPRFDTTHSR